MAKHYFLRTGFNGLRYTIYREDPPGGQLIEEVASCEIEEGRSDNTQENHAALKDDAFTLARIVTKAHEIGLRETLKRLLTPEETGA